MARSRRGSAPPTWLRGGLASASWGQRQLGTGMIRRAPVGDRHDSATESCLPLIVLDCYRQHAGGITAIQRHIAPAADQDIAGHAELGRQHDRPVEHWCEFDGVACGGIDQRLAQRSRARVRELGDRQGLSEHRRGKRSSKQCQCEYREAPRAVAGSARRALVGSCVHGQWPGEFASIDRCSLLGHRAIASSRTPKSLLDSLTRCRPDRRALQSWHRDGRSGRLALPPDVARVVSTRGAVRWTMSFPSVCARRADSDSAGERPWPQRTGSRARTPASSRQGRDCALLPSCRPSV